MSEIYRRTDGGLEVVSREDINAGFRNHRARLIPNDAGWIMDDCSGNQTQLHDLHSVCAFLDIAACSACAYQRDVYKGMRQAI